MIKMLGDTAIVYKLPAPAMGNHCRFQVPLPHYMERKGWELALVWCNPHQAYLNVTRNINTAEMAHDLDMDLFVRFLNQTAAWAGDALPRTNFLGKYVSTMRVYDLGQGRGVFDIPLLGLLQFYEGGSTEVQNPRSTLRRSDVVHRTAEFTAPSPCRGMRVVRHLTGGEAVEAEEDYRRGSVVETTFSPVGTVEKVLIQWDVLYNPEETTTTPLLLGARQCFGLPNNTLRFFLQLSGV